MRESIKEALAELRGRATADLQAIDRVEQLIEREDGCWSVETEGSGKEWPFDALPPVKGMENIAKKSKKQKQ